MLQGCMLLHGESGDDKEKRLQGFVMRKKNIRIKILTAQLGFEKFYTTKKCFFWNDAEIYIFLLNLPNLSSHKKEIFSQLQN